MNVSQFFIICKMTNSTNNATQYVKLGKKKRESSKRNYYIISPRVIIKAIVINYANRASLKRACRGWRRLQNNGKREDPQHSTEEQGKRRRKT